jgi:hypothetical protein
MKKLIFLAFCLPLCASAQVNVQGTNIQIGGNAPANSVPATPNLLKGDNAGGVANSGIDPATVCLLDGTNCPAAPPPLPATTNIITGDGAGGGADSGIAASSVCLLDGTHCPATTVYPPAGIPVSTGTAWGTSKAAPTGALVGDTDTQTLTNKTLNGGLATADPSAALGLATKQYVDAHASGVSACPSATGTNSICVTNSPYYASGSALSTTTSSASSAATSITLAATCSAAGFDATGAGTGYTHQGVSISGAGAAGAYFIGTVSSCTGSTMTLSAGITSAVATDTTTASTTNGSGSITVTSATGINVGDSISGSGIASSTIVIAISGTTVTMSKTATATNATASLTFTPTVKHDDTNALQSAVTAIAAIGGTIYFPNGSYLINGPLQDTGGANAVVILPATPLSVGTTKMVRLSGLSQPNVYINATGATLISDRNSGNLIGGYSASGPYGGFIGYDFEMDHLRIQSTSTNPGAVMVNATYFATSTLNDVLMYSNAPGTPTNTTGGGYSSPTLSNNVYISVDHLTVVGFYALARFGEHSHVGHIEGANSHLGWVFDAEPGSDPSHSTWGNSIAVDYLWCQLCDNAISAGIAPTTINVQVADFEVATTAAVNDPSNLLYGAVYYNVPYTDGRSTSTVYNAVVTGGSNLRMVNLKYPGVCPTRDTGSTPQIGFCASSNTPNVTISNAVSGQVKVSGNPASGVPVLQTTTSTVPSILNIGSSCTAGTCYNANTLGTFPNWLNILQFPSTWTTSGLYVPNMGALVADTGETNGLLISALASNAPIRFASGGSEKARITNGLCLGCTTDPGAGNIQSAGTIVAGGNVGGSGSGEVTVSATSTAASAFISAYGTIDVDMILGNTANTTGKRQFALRNKSNQIDIALLTDAGVYDHNIGTWSLSAPANSFSLDSAGRWSALAYITPTLTGTFSTTQVIPVTSGAYRLVLTANVTSSTIAAGADGQRLCINLVQDATGGWTFAWPTNMLGVMTVGTTAGKRNQQCFVYYAAGTAWVAESAGMTNM